MKQVLTYILILISITLCSQTETPPNLGICGEYFLSVDSSSIEYYHITDSDTIDGKIDLSKFQNGDFNQFVKFYYRSIIMNPVKVMDSNNINTYHYESSINYSLFQGSIRNGEKTGKWRYYVELNNLFPETRNGILGVDYSIEYYDSCYVLSTIGRETSYKYDSTIISGIDYSSKFNVEFECDREFGCIYKLQRNGKKITTSNYKDFEITLIKIRAGLFDRFIKFELIE